MAAGYFNDGSINIELGAHVFASTTGYRRNLSLTPHGSPARILDSGGGTQELSVRGQRLRANMGDAERWIYEILLALATSDPGELGVQDNLGNQAVFGDAVCVGASGEVQAFRFADVRYTFLAPEVSAQGAFGAVPAAPATYGGTSTAQNYQVDAADVGDHGVSLRIEMTRSYPLREIPRCRGARARGPASNARIRLIVTSHLVDTTQTIWEAVEALVRGIGPRHVDLTGNGNTYADVLLESVRPGLTDLNHTAIEAEFLMEV